MLNSIIKVFNGTLFNKTTTNCLMEQVRTRITCSKNTGKEKSVQTAMERYFRIDKRAWIKSQPGHHYRLYNKNQEKRFLLQQPVICSKTESKMLERMSGKFYKNLKLENFVDPPMTHFHQFINKSKFKRALGDKKFFP